MRSLRMFLLLGCALAAGGIRVPAEQLPMTAQEAVTRALAADPSVAAQAELVSAAESVLRSRRLDRLPGLGLSLSYTRLNEVDPIPITGTTPPANAYGLGAEFSQPLFSGGRLSERIHGAEIEVEAARRGVETARLELQLRVVRTYWQLKRHAAAVAAIEERLTQIRELSQELESRFGQGLVTRQEILRLRSLEADTGLRLERSRHARELTAMELALLTGPPQGAAIVPVSELPVDLPALPAQDSLWQRAKTEHPQLAAAVLREQSARSAERAARAGLFPSLVLNAGYGFHSPDSRSFPPQEELTAYWQLGALLHFDLLSPLRVPVLVHQAAAQGRSARNSAQAVKEQLLLSLKRAYSEALLAEEEIQAAGTAQAYAEELHRSVQDRYDQGTVLRSELLDAQAAVLEAELRLIDARVNRVVSRAALAAAAGTGRAEAWVAPSGFVGKLP
jgi:outer membrane protein